MKRKLLGIGITFTAGVFAWLGPEWSMLMDLAFAVLGAFICFGAIRLKFGDRPFAGPSLSRYVVTRYNQEIHTVIAHDATPDERDPQTVIFTAPDGTTVAIHTHVSRVEGYPEAN